MLIEFLYETLVKHLAAIQFVNTECKCIWALYNFNNNCKKEKNI